eukprot:scaffold50381_cov22-Tisochrysis_lutea.AAC.1
MDLMGQKQHVCAAMACKVKRTKKNAMYTGLAADPRLSKKQRADDYVPPLHDDKIEDTKDSILLCCPNLRVERVDETCLDPSRQIKLQRRAEERGEGGEEEDCEGTDHPRSQWLGPVGVNAHVARRGRRA